MLDAFGVPADTLAAVHSAFAAMQGAASDLAGARKLAAERDTRRELAEFQLGELRRAGLNPATPDEDSTLSATRDVLASAERIERLCAEGFSALYESDTAVLSGLSGVWKRVGELATFEPCFKPYLEQREAIKAQLDDLAHMLRRYADDIDASPARLQHVEERLALLERLKRKYGPTLADVLARQEALARDVMELERAEERMTELDALLTSCRARYVEAAEAVSRIRRTQALGFAQQIEAHLAELAMDSTRFEVRFNAEPLPESLWSADGIDQAEFFVSPNPGEDLRPLARIVSGGELSRIMLAVRTLTTETQRSGEEGSRPSLIFDEVDAGIGGRVADVVGSKLRRLGTTFQVLCITHLPQIAACADAHFRIEKRIEGGRTSTLVTRLDDASRVEELARMIGGNAVTDAIRRSAREMLEVRRGAVCGEDRPKGESERSKAKVRRRTS
jgi:DNA repair protein RecN (Recombination protein N)